jgi:REP element-mobilizing transposase RayT
MPRSVSLILVHLIFSTKDRQPALSDDIRPALFAYLATVIRNSGCECYRVGGVADHVHLAVRMGKEQTIAKLIEQVKSSSSKWLKTQSPGLRRFAWQRGYGAFSVGPTDIQALLRYIDEQEVHHRKHSFQDEFVAFLRKYGIDSEDAHLWD